jgi:hypothetical protein
LRESVSERIERIERGAMIEKYLFEKFGMESLKFKGTNEEFKGENYVFFVDLLYTNYLFPKHFPSRKSH